MSNMREVLSKDSVTSQKDVGRRFSVPLNMTSSICEPRIIFADCSPRTQRMESATLDLPQPLGPTMQVTPSERGITVLSAKDLNPTSSICLKVTIKYLALPAALPPAVPKEPNAAKARSVKIFLRANADCPAYVPQLTSFTPILAADFANTEAHL